MGAKKSDKLPVAQVEATKQEKEISADAYSGQVGLHKYFAYALNKKFKGQANTVSEWNKICKNLGITKK